MMRSAIFLTSAAAVLSSASVAVAQRPGSAISVNRGAFAITPYAGYLITQNFLEGPLNTTLGIQGSPVYGAQLSLPLAPTAAIVGTIGYGSGDLEAGIPLVGGISLGKASTLLLDASVELRLERAGARAVPVFQLGGGAIRREVTVLGMSADATDFHVSGALGADLPLAPNIALRIMAKDHYGKADFGSVGDLHARTDDLHAVALTGGVRIAF